jgi:hypothetical protein
MLPQDYRSLLDGDDVPPSWLVAQLPPEMDCPGVTGVLERVRAADLPLIEARPAHHRDIPDARWELELHFDLGDDESQEMRLCARWELELHFDLGDDESQEMRLWVVPSEELVEFHLDWAHLSEQEKTRAGQSRWSLGLSTDFGPEPLADFHRQLRVLATIAPEALVFFDVTACRAHGISWVREAAGSEIPPPPTSLFAIHAVYADERKNKDTAWLHTHGLIRCGIPELEMLDVQAEAVSSCGLLLNTVAAMFLEGGPPAPAAPFEPGAGMELIWLPWEQALGRAGRGQLGRLADRDEHHSSPSAVLFAPKRRLLGKKMCCPSVYQGVLEDNPLLFVSSMETNRMAALARERLPRFASLFDENATEEDWVFLVKLGYPVDDADEAEDREHLWFQVHHLSGASCEATLLNEPYGVSGMHEGERAEHDLGLLTDWQILCPHGRFSADTVVHLQRLLDRGSPTD